MWVFQEFDDDCFTVGYFKPNGEWVACSDHKSPEEAAERIHYLNGGQSAPSAGPTAKSRKDKSGSSSAAPQPGAGPARR